MRPLTESLLAAEWAAVRAFAPNVIVGHPKSLAVPNMAEAFGCSYFLASPLPGFTPTAAFPTPLLPFSSLGPLNRVSHALAIRGPELLFGRLVGRWREQALALPRRRSSTNVASGTLYAYSPQVVAVPPDWGHDVLVSGYWFLDSDEWQPDATLAAFLEEGDLPVYIAFGSMPGLDPKELTVIVIEALRNTGKRGLLATGAGALEAANAPATVHVIKGAPHDRLFPLVAATIHHGGAGTTGALLRAGKPTAVCPFFGDQPFWGRRVAELGMGPYPLHRRALTLEGLAAAIMAMYDPNMRSRVAALGAMIRQENGVAAAAEFIERRTIR